jgi:bleomycin hydrolase
MSKEFVKYKTTDIMVHKDGLPKSISQKLKI